MVTVSMRILRRGGVVASEGKKVKKRCSASWCSMVLSHRVMHKVKTSGEADLIVPTGNSRSGFLFGFDRIVVSTQPKSLSVSYQ